MRFQIASSANRTGVLLQSLVAQELGGVNLGGVVCYGVGYSGNEPALNARCSAMNKLSQAHALRQALGEGAILPLTCDEAKAVHSVVLGRNTQHTKGKDIRLCVENWQVEALRSVSDFFTPYVPSSDEYRIWIYRRRHLGTYRKQLMEPQKMKRVGRNYENGFHFMRMEADEVPADLKDISKRAVAALGLDFGAVDVLSTPDGYVVLEVNSAPGVADARRSVIQKLAHRVARWAQEGFPDATSQASSAD